MLGTSRSTSAITAKRARLVQRRFDDGDVVAEFDEHAVVRAAGDQPQALAEHLRLHAHRLDGRGPHIVGHGQRCIGNVHARRGDGFKTETMIAAAGIGLMSAVVEIHVIVEARHHHAADIAVVGVDELDIEVADDRVGNPGLHALNQVLGVDRAVHAILPADQVRHHGHAPAILVARETVGSARRKRAFQEAVRRQVDLEPPQLGLFRLRNGLSLRVHRPGVVAADQIDDLLILQEGEAGAAALERVATLRAGVFLLRRHRLEIDGARVVLEIDARPIDAGVEILADHALPAGAGILDGLHVGDAHLRRSGLQ